MLAALADVPRLQDRCALTRRPARLGRCATLGIDIVDAADDACDWIVTPGPLRGPAQIGCGLGGRSCALSRRSPRWRTAQTFDGDARARIRPMRDRCSMRARAAHAVAPASMTALRAARLRRRRSGARPWRVGHHRRVRVLAVRFRSALAGSRYDDGLTVTTGVGTPLPSEPHVAMTVETIRDAASSMTARATPGAEPGAAVGTRRGRRTRTRPMPRPSLAAALVTGGSVRDPLAGRTMRPRPATPCAIPRHHGRGRPPRTRRVDRQRHGHHQWSRHRSARRLGVDPGGGGPRRLRRRAEHHPQGRPYPWARDRPHYGAEPGAPARAGVGGVHERAGRPAHHTRTTHPSPWRTPITAW